MKSGIHSIFLSQLPMIFCSLHISFDQDLVVKHTPWLRKLQKSSSVLFGLALMLQTIRLGTYEHITDAEQVSFKKWGSIWIICQATDDKKLFLTPARMSDYFDNKLKQAWKLEITRIKLSPANDWAPPFSTFSSVLAINMSPSLIEIGSLLLATRGIHWMCGTNFQPDQEDNLFLMWVLSWELKNSLCPLWLLACKANCNVQLLNVRIFSLYGMFTAPNNFYMITVFNNFLITILIRNVLLAYRRYQGTEVRNKDIPDANHLHKTSNLPIQEIRTIAKQRARFSAERRKFSLPAKWLSKAFKMKWSSCDQPPKSLCILNI